MQNSTNNKGSFKQSTTGLPSDDTPLKLSDGQVLAPLKKNS
jgi:hypothetical protein